jgi:hypothetical protein
MQRLIFAYASSLGNLIWSTQSAILWWCAYRFHYDVSVASSCPPWQNDRRHNGWLKILTVPKERSIQNHLIFCILLFTNRKTSSEDGSELQPFTPIYYELYATFVFDGDFCRTSAEKKAAKRSFKVKIFVIIVFKSFTDYCLKIFRNRFKVFFARNCQNFHHDVGSWCRIMMSDHDVRSWNSIMIFDHDFRSWFSITVSDNDVRSWCPIMMSGHDVRSWCSITMFDHEIQSWFSIMIFDHGIRSWFSITVSDNDVRSWCSIIMFDLDVRS